MLILVSILDKVAGVHNPPTVHHNIGVALRSIADGVKADERLASNADDYSIWLVGEFDQDSGVVSPEVPPRHLSEVSGLVRGGK